MPGDVEGGIESVGCKHAGGDEQNGDLVGHELDQARLVGRDHGPRPWSQGCVASRVSVRCTPVQFGHDLSLLGLDDGRSLFSGGQDGAICLWDLCTNRVVHKEFGHRLAITCLRRSMVAFWPLSPHMGSPQRGQSTLAQTFADRIIGLRDGLLVFDGTPEDLGHDVLTDIYGEEDWSTTLRDVEAEEDGQARHDRDQAEREAAAG